jgi:hypothetical protein
MKKASAAATQRYFPHRSFQTVLPAATSVAHGALWWLECALVKSGVLVQHHDPAKIGCSNQFACSALHALARSTGAAISQGQETAQH